MTFNEFTDALREAGWRAPYDAQFTNIKKLWEEKMEDNNCKPCEQRKCYPNRQNDLDLKLAVNNFLFNHLCDAATLAELDKLAREIYNMIINKNECFL